MRITIDPIGAHSRVRCEATLPNSEVVMRCEGSVPVALAALIAYLEAWRAEASA